MVEFLRFIQQGALLLDLCPKKTKLMVFTGRKQARSRVIKEKSKNKLKSLVNNFFSIRISYWKDKKQLLKTINRRFGVKAGSIVQQDL
jgi:hypothetical protein